MGLGFIMSNDFEIAKKIKGYGSFKGRLSQKEIVCVDNRSVKINVINSLSDYIELICKLNTSFENPIFYRGQKNANFLLNPASLRKNPANENLFIEEFSRHFSNEINECYSAISKLILMQHYRLPTRCLDITENPLVALYFACEKNVSKSEDESWGEIILFKEKSAFDKKIPERLKTDKSSNVSIVANTAFMDEDFSLWQLGAYWKNDANQAFDERFLNLKTIVRDCFIVRVPQNNPRIKNQQGATIVANANYVYLENANSEKMRKKITKCILDYEEDYICYQMLFKKCSFKAKLKINQTWNMRFQKVKPYCDENTIEVFKNDPFNFQKIYYRDCEGNQIVILIPPDKKEKIQNELTHFNITNSFIYPDMETVANKICEYINK